MTEKTDSSMDTVLCIGFVYIVSLTRTKKQLVREIVDVDVILNPEVLRRPSLHFNTSW
jgi:hypothetical protein